MLINSELIRSVYCSDLDFLKGDVNLRVILRDKWPKAGDGASLNQLFSEGDHALVSLYHIYDMPVCKLNVVEHARTLSQVTLNEGKNSIIAVVVHLIIIETWVLANALQGSTVEHRLLLIYKVQILIAGLVRQMQDLHDIPLLSWSLQMKIVTAC